MAYLGRRNLTLDEALTVIRGQAIAPAPEPVALAELAGRVLAEDVRARVDHPPFSNSAMDGYALRAADAAQPQRLVGESRAGAPFTRAVGPGEAVRISTGAELPLGVDTILRSEDAEEDEGYVRARVSPPLGAHVRRRGEDLRAGQVVLPAGIVVAPHEVTVVAAAGLARVACLRRPRVALIGSGDELVAPGGELGPGQIFDSNRPGLTAQAEAAGAEMVAIHLVPDDPEATLAAVRAALDPHEGPAPDLLMTIGGVSVGRHDHLRPAFEAAGVREVFYGVQIRPGHPLWLGRRGEQLVLGLPGNPVSAAVCFHVFGRPLLGRADPWESVRPLAAPYRKTTQRAELIRCREVAGGLLEPLPRQGSNAISSLAGATHLALVPADKSTLPASARVRCCRLV